MLHIFSNFVPSGPELRAIRLMEAFGGRFRHAVLSMDGRTDAVEHLSDCNSVRILERLPKAGSLSTAARLRRLLRAERPALVLTYGWGAFDMLLAACSIRFPHVVHHEDGFNADEAVAFKRRRIWARRLILPSAHRVIVPSRRLHAIATGLWRLPTDKVALIPNGIQLDRFLPADGHQELRRRLAIPTDAFLVGTIGHLRTEKNHRRLIDAIASFGHQPHVHLLLVGDGPERAALQSHADEARLRGRVHFVGHQSDPRAFLRALDLFALSSDTEQMPVSLLEAMASGLSVVSTSVGDVQEMLPEDQLRFLISPDAPDAARAMAANIGSLLGDPALRRRLGAANRDRVRQRYSFEQMSQRYLAVYESALSARQRS